MGSAWREPAYDDETWSSGRALIGASGGFGGGLPIGTRIALGPPTFYFRKTFMLDEQFDVERIVASISTQIDDGFVAYLNGQEVVRRRMPQVDIEFDTLASDNVRTASVEGPFTISNGLLKNGENVFAVEVHQSSLESGDVIFGLSFDATATIVKDNTLETLDGGLRITEIMYNSEGDGPLDYIELTNIADQPLDLTGVRLSGGIDFVFPAVVLQPNQFVVVAEDAAAFTNRYGRNVNLVGQYTGNLSNGGETIALRFADPFDAAILRFTYSHAWYPETDGQGRSLEIVDPTLRFDRWSTKEAWQASSLSGGTPGSGQSVVGIPGDFNNDGIVDTQELRWRVFHSRPRLRFPAR